MLVHREHWWKLRLNNTGRSNPRARNATKNVMPKPDHLHLDPLLLSVARQQLAEEGIEATPAEYETGLREWVDDVQDALAEEGILLTLDEVMTAARVFSEVFPEPSCSN